MKNPARTLTHILARTRATTGRRSILIGSVLAALLGLATSFGFATSLPVASRQLMVARPSQLPPACSGTATLTPVADAWIGEKKDKENHGTDQSIFVHSRTGGQNMRSLIRFDLSAIPAGCTVSRATLRLYATSADSSRVVDVYRVSGSWTETDVAWRNQPATVGAPASQPAGPGWRSWSVTVQVQAMFAGSNHGFLLRDETENNVSDPQEYVSREGAAANRPQLIVDWN